MWKHFTTAYSDEYPLTGDIFNAVPISENDVDVLFDLIPGAIGSPGGLFLTALTLFSRERRRADPSFDPDAFDMEEAGMELSRAQWVAISGLDNLAILKIHGSFGGSFVDQVVRAWAHRSVVDGALSRLQALGLHNQDSLTLASLLELAKIRSLMVVQWSRRAITKESIKIVGEYGWKLAEESVFEAQQQGLNRPLLNIRCGPKTTLDSTFTVTLVPDPEWKASKKRQANENNVETSRPAPSKRPNMRKGAKRDAASLLSQFLGM